MAAANAPSMQFSAVLDQGRSISGIPRALLTSPNDILTGVSLLSRAAPQTSQQLRNEEGRNERHATTAGGLVGASVRRAFRRQCLIACLLR